MSAMYNENINRLERVQGMKIAILLGGLRFDSQRRIINGILKKAEQDGTNVYIFTCDAWTYSASHYNNGETAIFSLPNFKSFDGIILHGDTIYDEEVTKRTVEAILQSGVPCVSLNVKYDGMLYVGMENANGIYEIVNHMIHVHHAKRFNFISGPEGNSDSQGREQAFRQALSDNGIILEEERVYRGDYHPESGKEAVVHFCEEKLDFPDAIIAANDEMALGAFYELQERGYHVPEQVLLTGYDYAFAGRYHSPKITSVKRPEMELGANAYDKLKAYINGEPIREDEELLCWPVFTESCGCKDKVREDLKDFRKRFVKEKLHVTTYSEIVKSSSADFTGAVTFEQLLVTIRKYIAMMNPEEFYLCMCVVDEPLGGEVMPQINTEISLPDMTKYTPEICIPIAYRDGIFSQHGKFESQELLPEEYTKNNSGSLYTVVPIHYLERCYGYCVLGNNRLMLDSELFHLFIMNVNNALENIRKQNMLNSMVERLNRMWVYDTLTGVFNRAGFFRFATNIIKEAQELNQNLFVLFLDLDGLKKVNDKYGHDEGDAFIKAMANVLSRVHRHGELLMRYGGDEFVVLARGYSHAEAKTYMLEVQTGIENYNATSAHPYTLAASMGYTIMKPEQDFDLEEMIEAADQEMYKEKKEKKRRQ